MLRSAVLLAILLLILAAPGWASWPPADKVCGSIAAARAAKEHAATARSRAEAVDFLRARGLDPDRPDSVAIALYAEAPLSPRERAEFDAQGVRVRDLWVPPVPGRHPLGFHLAEMRFGSEAFLQADPRVAFAASIEATAEPMNDLAGVVLRFAEAHSGAGGTTRLGQGVRIAIVDSGFDINHPDVDAERIAEAFDMTTGEDASEWSTVVANTVTDHGTHVMGSVAGTGLLSGGKYAGGAPAATMHLYKVGNDTNAAANLEDIIEAVMRALDTGCDILTLSYGGVGGAMDGSNATEQAIDFAFSQGMLSFIAAGNSAQNRHHATVVLEPGAAGIRQFRIANQDFDNPLSAPQPLQLRWVGDTAPEHSISVSVLNLAEGESFEVVSLATSARGTRTAWTQLAPSIPAGEARNYFVRVENTAADGPPLRVHFYCGRPNTFINFDPAFTVTTPGIADTAVTVGSYTHRGSWRDFTGEQFNFGQVAGEMSSFSGIGPRIDGFPKPDIAAPGSAVISLGDSDIPAASAFRISNSGVNDGEGPANYVVKQGTSMATPLAAGASALLFEAAPAQGWGAEEIRALILDTAAPGNLPSDRAGAGMMSVPAALAVLEAASVPDWALFD